MTPDARQHADGTVSTLMRRRNWTATPIGPPDDWPRTLSATLDIMLPSPVPSLLLWGSERLTFYNDASVALLGFAHPHALGRPAAEWSATLGVDLDVLAARAIAGGAATSGEFRWVATRDGHPEEAYGTLSCSVVPDERGAAAGVLCVGTDTTAGHIDARRLRTLRDLAAASGAARTAAAACSAAVEVLARNSADVPFALLYLADEASRFHLTSHCGVEPGRPGVPFLIAAGADAEWPLSTAVAGRQPLVIAPLTTRFARVPAGPWPEPPAAALVLPLRHPAIDRPLGALVVGLNARRPLDEEYRDWCALVAGQIGWALVGARAAFIDQVGHDVPAPLARLLGTLEQAVASRSGGLRGADLEAALVHEIVTLRQVREEGQQKLSEVNRDLQNRVAELETLLSVIPIGIGIALDPECRTIKVNPGFAATLGLSPDANASLSAPEEERPDFRVLDRTGRELSADELPLQVAAREGHEVRDVELDVVHHDGRVVHLLEYAVPLFDDHGAPRGSIGAFVDITERRVSEARNQFLVRLDDAVRTTADPSEIMAITAAMLGMHLNASRCAYADVDEDGEHFTIRHEYRRDEPHPTLTGDWALSPFGAAVADRLRSGHTLVVADVRREMPDHADAFEALAIRATICAVAVRQGRLTAMMAVHTDVPRAWTAAEVELVQLAANRSWESIARARAMRELGESELRYRTLFDSIESGFCTCQMLFDAAGEPTDYRFIEVNARFEELAGVDDPVGHTARELFTDLDDEVIATLGLVARTGAPARFERRREGVDRWFDVYAFRFGQAGSHMLGVLFTDVTDRKRIEANLRQSNRMKDEFLATLSHELRTPLNAVLGWTHMIRTGTLRKDVEARALESLERNARAQAQLVDDLLDVSRIISGKLQIRHDPVVLDEVVAGALETIYPAALNRGVTLKHERGRAEQIVVTGDPDRLRQVVWNLLSNAVKFTPAGGVVHVRLQHDEAQASVEVQDTGQGIDPEFLPFVFDRFRQADGTPTRRHGGLGLGLAIVRHLIEAHGGTVDAASDGANRGATFTIRLPCAAAAGRPRRNRRRPLVTIGGSALKHVAVLVVDDEADARDLMRAILEGAGATVAAAASAGEALHQLQQDHFDVMVADIGMPDRDGFSLIRAIRGLPDATRDLPAVAVTAYASARERELALDAGYGWHVAKPVEPEHLVTTLTVALRRQTADPLGG